MIRLPSGVPPYGVCGFIGRRSLSKTHKESMPSPSAFFAICITFSLVACWPACGSEIPTFKIISNYVAAIKSTTRLSIYLHGGNIINNKLFL
jgi:hypothetical protein